MKLNTSTSDYLIYTLDSLTIEILGGIKLSGLDRLRCTFKITMKDSEQNPLRETIDLYQSTPVSRLVEKMSDYFDLSQMYIDNLLHDLTNELEQYRLKELDFANNSADAKVELSDKEFKEAKKYLSSKNLMDKTMSDIGKSGIAGEELNRMLLFLVFTSRLMDKPLHALIMGNSGVGKTHLQEKVGELIPEEEKIEITSLTRNSLYYYKKHELDGKLLLLEDLDGASSALFPIRELMSKGRISKTVTQRDTKGDVKTITNVVEAKVCVSGCTTKESIYEDNSNRSIQVHIDDSKEQSERILSYHKHKSSGLIKEEEEQALKALFKNCQRILKPMKVVNPYADELRLPNHIKNVRRTMNQYLQFINVITFYHQYQREIKDSTIETTIEDIEWANKLLRASLLRKTDELTGASRRFLQMLKEHLKDQRTFYLREVRNELRINPSTIKRYMKELESFGYIQIVKGNRYKGYEYKLLMQEEYSDIQANLDTSMNDLLNYLKSSQVVGQ